MVGAFRETSQQGFGERLKGAFGGIVVGLGLFVAAFPLQWWNEGRAVQQRKSLEEGAAAVVATSSERVDPANEGRLVHVAGRVQAAAPLADPDFGLAVDALALERRVEMYQWREKRETKEQRKLGGGTETVTEYRYSLDWDDDAIDSSGFRHADGHRNPGSLPVGSRKVAAERAKLGAFALGPDIAARFDDWQRFDVPAEATAALDGFRRVDAGFYRGGDPASPQVGDVRVRFRRVPEGEYSFVARQSGDGLVQYPTRAGNSILLVECGLRDAQAMFASAHAANDALTWLLRGAGMAAMWLGLFLVVRPLAVLADVVPLLGGLLAKGLGVVAFVLAACFSLLTMGLAWLSHRPALGIALLLLGFGAAFWLRKRRPRAAAVPSVMPPPPPGAAVPPPPPIS
jgi:hypothetical protein